MNNLTENYKIILIRFYNSDNLKLDLNGMQDKFFEEILSNKKQSLYIFSYRTYLTETYSSRIKNIVYFHSLEYHNNHRFIDEKDLNRYGTIWIYKILF